MGVPGASRPVGRVEHIRRRMRRAESQGGFGVLYAGALAPFSVATASLLTVGLSRPMNTGLVIGGCVCGLFGLGCVGGLVSLATGLGPHRLARPSEEQIDLVHKLREEGAEYLRDWEGWATTLQMQIESEQQAFNALQVTDKCAVILGMWKLQTDVIIREELGPKAAQNMQFSTHPTVPVPDWIKGDPWSDMWREVVCRLDWLRDWLLAQTRD